jgi:hypothetical protein
MVKLAEQLIPVSAAEHGPIDGAEQHQNGTDDKQDDTDRRHDADARQPTDQYEYQTQYQHVWLQGENYEGSVPVPSQRAMGNVSSRGRAQPPDLRASASV